MNVKIRQAVCLPVLLFLIFLQGHAAARAFEASGLKTITSAKEADAFIAAFLGEEPESLDEAYLMTGQMKAAVDAAGGFKGLAASLILLGKAKEIFPAYPTVIQGLDAFRVPCRFSVMPADLVLVLDHGAIAGLVTDHFSGDEQKPAAKADAESMTESDTETGPETEPSAFTSTDLALPVPSFNGELPGTLTLPQGEGPFPALILVHGSGPNDRDETVMNIRPFRDLAEGLAKKGIAVYRYDKRTFVYGSEMESDHQITLEDETIADASAAVLLLAGQEKIDPGKIFVLGHSLGGSAIPAIDRELKTSPVKACGYILMAPAARGMDELMREQYDFLYSLKEQISDAEQAEKDRLFKELDQLEDPDSLPDDALIAGAYAPYWRWLAHYNILEAAQEITVPCLLLQGEEDYQVTMKDFEMFRQAIGGKENWTLISYPGLVHLFVSGQKTEGTDVYMREGHVDPQVINDIAEFIQSLS